MKKFLHQVQQITFNGEYAIKQGHSVTFITERAVFLLTAEGLRLTEIAPGVDLQKDILAQMEFKPAIDNNLTLMDPRLFNQGPMNLQHSGSHPAGHMRKLWSQLITNSDTQTEDLDSCIAS